MSDYDSVSVSDSDSDSPSATKKGKIAKYQGAAKYDTKFNPSWSKTYPCFVE